MIVDFLKSPIGILSLVAIDGWPPDNLVQLVNLAAIFVCSLRWSDEGDVYIQIIFQQRGWQTVVLLCLSIAFIVTGGLFLFRLLAPREKVERIRKTYVLVLFVIVVVLCAFASAIELWYVLSDKGSVGMARIVFCMVMCIFLLMISIMLLLLLACDFKRYIHVENTHTAVVKPAPPQPTNGKPGNVVVLTPGGLAALRNTQHIAALPSVPSHNGHVEDPHVSLPPSPTDSEKTHVLR